MKWQKKCSCIGADITMHVNINAQNATGPDGLLMMIHWVPQPVCDACKMPWLPIKEEGTTDVKPANA